MIETEHAELDELMARLADGDRAVFTRVFHLLRAPVERLCRSLLRNDVDAADAAQEAMQKILERAADYDESRPAMPWALAIAGWECRTLARKRTRRRESSDENQPEPSSADDEEKLVQHDLTNAALGALGQMSEADGEALLATYWGEATSIEGATFESVANGPSIDSAAHSRGSMASTDMPRLLRRARWGYEVARLRRAALGVAPIAVIAVIVACVGEHPLPMLTLGPATALHPDECTSLCMYACVIGGFAAALGVSVVGYRRDAGPAFWLSASGIALLTGAIGCARVALCRAGWSGVGFFRGCLVRTAAATARKAQQGLSSTPAKGGSR